MPTFRELIKTYVDDHWLVPCGDGMVWLFNAGIDTRTEIAKQKKATKKEWAATFLQYADPTFGWLEGLYLIAPADLAKVKAGQIDATSYPDRKMISSWYDINAKNTSNAEVLAQKPAYFGLNDCAHFVTQSLAAGGIHVETRGVGELFNLLRGLKDTKTLAKTVTAAAAKNIINSGVMKTGDVIIYSKGTEHHHSVVYMGSAQIAMHTWANHPNHPTLHGDWEASADDNHPLVTLIHFGRDDAPINPTSGMLGWWKVGWRGTDYYYYFERTGRVGWTQHAPANLKQPLHAPGGRGYWFQEPLRISICWTDSSSFEELAVRPPLAATHLEGTWNGSDRIVADKM
jgi:hypothetical protein